MITDEYIRKTINARRIELGKEPTTVFINPKDRDEVEGIYKIPVGIGGVMTPLQTDFWSKTLYGLKIERDYDLPEGMIKVV